MNLWWPQLYYRVQIYFRYFSATIAGTSAENHFGGDDNNDDDDYENACAHFTVVAIDVLLLPFSVFIIFAIDCVSVFVFDFGFYVRSFFTSLLVNCTSLHST